MTSLLQFQGLPCTRRWHCSSTIPVRLLLLPASSWLALFLVASTLKLTAGLTDPGDAAALKALNDEVIKASGQGIRGWFPANQTDPCGDYPDILPFPGVLCFYNAKGQTAPVRVVSLVLYNAGITATNIAPITALTQVTGLAILGNNITAPLPPGLGSMPFLANIDFRNNRLSGAIPDLTGAPLRTLLLGNQTGWGDPGLTGGIPASLAQITTLSILDLSLNSISGPIPPALTRLPKLNSLVLRSNKLTGKIPPLKPLTNTLQTLDISHNPFDPSPMPKDLNKMTILGGTLDMSYMNFVGPMANLRNMGSVVDLILDGNRLSGPLYPKSLPLGSLGFLSIRNNGFSGPIKSNLLDVMRNNIYCMANCGINFANNSFSGSLPASLGFILQAFTFDFSNNKLTGTIPNTYGYIYSMLQLKLQNNRLTGPPPNFDPPPDKTYQLMLAELDLSGNLLSGTFPEKITRFTRLKHIDMSNNKLYGTLPDISALNQLQYLNVSGNRFVGMPPPVPTASTLDFSNNFFGGTYKVFAAKYQKGQRVLSNLNCFRCSSKKSGKCKQGLPPQRKVSSCINFCKANVNQPPCRGGTCNLWPGAKQPQCQCPGTSKLYLNVCPK